MLCPVCIAAFLYAAVNKRSRKIETGMMGAVGYGFLGFLWQQLIYLMMIVVLSNATWLRDAIGSDFILSAFVYGLVCSIFVALGLYWGIYLTNQKQRSIYRSTAIGIGFGLGSLAWNILAPYGMSLYYAFQINAGVYAGDAQTKESILASSAAAMSLDALKCTLLLLVYMGVACLMSHYYLEGNKIYPWVVPVATQLLISLANAAMKEYMPEMAARIGIYVVLGLLAGAGVYIVVRRLKISGV